MDDIVTPTQRLCIDESMVLWRSRLIFPIYMKGKRHRYGIKLYMLTEPSGLVLRFLVYTGSSDSDVGGPGHVDNVVWKLMEGRLDSGRSLFMANYYNSVDLTHRLLERSTYCTGTLRSNRKGNPPHVLSKKRKRGEVVDAFSSEGVCVMKWKDKRDVLMISSKFGSELIDVRRRQGGGVTSKPEAIAQYYESMSGIDLHDQMMSYYPIERKTLKWYKKLGIHILHLVLVNSFFLFRKTHPKFPLYDCRLSVIRTLLSPSYSEPIPRSSPSLTPRVLGLSKHFPETHDIDQKRKRVPQRRCTFCKSRGFRKDSAYFCPACEGCPPLCLKPCFEAFHRNVQC
ncbi:piggyBac transposable element-derived protein 4-like isoform X1 [Ischnura elegans]|uniref:piggyBac transposable element-derived protein 4-like isoform X1 n=1 Tax=Ischnura elegans TaxID=197161 RepID=UPI001ED871D7|nr:piggyBac transposable element-derived protein 4-like isoform X1 [Ischnura elegans]